MCMHAADVSNPAKAWSLSSEWAGRVMQEFFEQGDQEAEQGLPVSPFMDRAKTDIGKCQAGFISILIKPFFEEWITFLGEANRHVVKNIEANIKTWQDQGEAALGARAEKLHAKPARKSVAQ
jgi:calcium/calmodulin-dependent 3',5'-cyclic nucleotide phosphodiesterase